MLAFVTYKYSKKYLAQFNYFYFLMVSVKSTIFLLTQKYNLQFQKGESDLGSCGNLEVVEVLQKLFQAYLLGLPNFYLDIISFESLYSQLFILCIYTSSRESFYY